MAPEKRLSAVVKWLSVQTGMRQKEIGLRVGYSNESSWSQLLTGKKDIPKAVPARIAALDPRINIDFLTGDSDEMFVDGAGADSRPQERPQTEQAGTSSTQPVIASKTAGIFVPAELAQMVTDLSATVREQQRIIGSLVDTWIKDKEGRR